MTSVGSEGADEGQIGPEDQGCRCSDRASEQEQAELHHVNQEQLSRDIRNCWAAKHCYNPVLRKLTHQMHKCYAIQKHMCMTYHYMEDEQIAP